MRPKWFVISITNDRIFWTIEVILKAISKMLIQVQGSVVQKGKTNSLILLVATYVSCWKLGKNDRKSVLWTQTRTDRMLVLIWIQKASGSDQEIP